MRTGTCDYCGAEFEDRSRAQRRRFCSDRHRRDHWEVKSKHPCVDCGILVWRVSERCKDCRLKAWEVARNLRRRVIADLYHQGVPLAELAPRVGYANANCLGVELDAMKHAGWDLPPRRSGWNGNKGSGPPARPAVTRNQARQRLNQAVRHGKAIRPDTCERCGAVARVEGHHHDYSKPLEVEWLCRPCHFAHHSETELQEAA